jgi:flavin reductase (DIM6/NTAB) family NADH-FMN oxidoreductase RutF
MNSSSKHMPADVDEFTYAGIEKADCDTIACARVAGSPATLECKVTQIIRLEGADNHAIFGEVTGVHMREDCIVDGRFDVIAAKLLSRLGYRDYAQVSELFELTRPDD